MIRLLRVELTRFFSRRLVRGGAAAALAITLLILFAAWDSAKPPSAEETERLRAEFDMAAEDWERTGEQQIEDCKADEERQQEIDPGIDFSCDEWTAPQWEDWQAPQQVFSDSLSRATGDFGLILVALAFVLGAGFISAEISTGAIGNWLTFEPRRTRVLASKLLAAALGTVPLVVTLVAVFVGGSYAIFAGFDALGDMNGDVWGDAAQTTLRIVLLAAGVAAVGAALGTLVKHIAGVLGLGIGYMVLGEGILAGLVPTVQPYLVISNVRAVINGSVELRQWECTSPTEPCKEIVTVLTQAHGAAVLGVMAVVIVAAAFVTFRRRDVS